MSFHTLNLSVGPDGKYDTRGLIVGGDTALRGANLAQTRFQQFGQVRPHFLAGTRDHVGVAQRREARLRSRLTGDDARKSAPIRAARLLDWDSRFKLANWMLVGEQMRMNPQAFATAADKAEGWTRACADSLARDAPFDPSQGGSQYLGLVAQNLIREMAPLPISHFEEIFPNVQGEAPIYPGMTHYGAARGQPVGRASQISATTNEGINILHIGTQSELRGTCWMAIAIEESLLVQYQRSIPGAPIFGLNEYQDAADLAMTSGRNRVEWFGDGGEMIGVLNDSSISHVRVRDASGNQVNAATGDPADVLDALIRELKRLSGAKRGAVPYDTAIISAQLGFDLCRQLKDTTGMTSESMISYLIEKVFKKAMPSITRIIMDVWELDHLGCNGLTAEEGGTLTNVHGMMLTTSGRFGIQRVPILETMSLPVVDEGLVKTIYKVQQFGRPWISGLGLNVILEFVSA